MNFNRLANQTIYFSFIALFVLTPLFFTPINSELFEFNKMLLTYLLTTLIAGSWLIKIIINKKIIFQRTPFDLPLILFLFSQILSALLSVNRHTSLFGYYSRSHGGLFSTISYLLLFYAFTANLNRTQVVKLLKIILLTVLLVCLYAIPEHFGHSPSCLLIKGQFNVDCWIQDVQSRVFATLGQPNWLAAYLTALITLPFAWQLLPQPFFSKLSRRLNHNFLTLLYLLCLTTLLFTKSRSGFLAFLATSTLFWLLVLFKTSLSRFPRRNFVVAALTTLILVSLIGTPYTPNLSQLIQNNPPSLIPTTSLPPVPTQDFGGSPSSEIRLIVWRGAFDIFRHYPLFGSGTETFAYTYYQFRPLAHNLVSEWDFLYNKAHNEFLNLLATTGLFGFLSYLAIILTFILFCARLIFKPKQKFVYQPLIIALLAGYLAILITNFFGFSVVVTAILFFLFPAFAFKLAQPKPTLSSQERKLTQTDSNSPHLTLSQKLLLIMTVIISATILISLAARWRADVLYNQGTDLTDTDLSQALNLLTQATRLVPNEPEYHQQLALSLAQAAIALNNQGDSTQAATLAQLADQESQLTLKLNPVHQNYLKNITRGYYTLSSLDPTYLQKAFQTLSQAIKLAPTDAKLIYNLGLMYQQIDDQDQAINAFQAAVALKPNYEAPRYGLALIYQTRQELDKAKAQLEYILKNINPENDIVKATLEKLTSASPH